MITIISGMLEKTAISIYLASNGCIANVSYSYALILLITIIIGDTLDDRVVLIYFAMTRCIANVSNTTFFFIFWS